MSETIIVSVFLSDSPIPVPPAGNNVLTHLSHGAVVSSLLYGLHFERPGFDSHYEGWHFPHRKYL